MFYCIIMIPFTDNALYIDTKKSTLIALREVNWGNTSASTIATMC